MTLHPRIPIFAALACLGACSNDDLDDEETRLQCNEVDPAKPVEATLAALDNSTTVTADLVVTGTATHTGGLAIRSLSVLGVPAESTGFNFEAWKVTVPLAVLRAQPAVISAAGREVELTVTVREPCSESGPIEVDIPDVHQIVYIDPSVELGTLSMSIDAPYLAPKPGASATLKITSEPKIEGARVVLEAVGVLFDGIADRSSVRLDAQGEAKLEIRATRAGPVSIVGRSDQDFAGVILDVGGKPTLSPSMLTLTAGAANYVSGHIDGEVAARVRCTASEATYATVHSAKGPLAPSVEFNLAAGDILDFVVEAADVVMPELLTVSCVETTFNQVSNTVVIAIE